MGAGGFVAKRQADVITKSKSEKKSSPIDCVSTELGELSYSVTTTS